MSGCLGTEDYGDDLFTFIVCKQKTSVTNSIRIFERANFGQTSEIVSITDRDRNLKEEILKEDCSGNCSKFPIGGSKSQKSPVMAVLCWEKKKKIFLNIEKGYGNDSKALIFIDL